MATKLLESPTPEGMLIERVLEQDSASFMQLYNRYLPLVCKIWYQYHLADLPLEDWKQEAAMVLLRTVRSYGNHEARFCWYLKQALTNKIRDLYRQQAAKKRIPAENMEPITELQIDRCFVAVHYAPDDIIEFRLIYRHFLQDCSKLEREVFMMINSGKRLEDIAQELGCSPLSVRSAFERARQKFLKKLNE